MTGLWRVWWITVWRRGPIGPLHLFGVLIWGAGVVHLARSTVALVGSDPEIITLAVPMVVAASVMLLVAVAVMFGLDPLFHNVRLYLLPWRTWDRLLVMGTLASPFAAGAVVVTWVALTWAVSVSLGAGAAGVVVVTLLLAISYGAVLVGVRILLLDVAPRAPSIAFYGALVLALVVGGSLVTTDPAADLVEMAQAAGLARSGPIGPWAALVLMSFFLAGACGVTALVAGDGTHPLARGSGGRHRSRGRLLGRVNGVVGPRAWKELVLLGRAVLARNALLASAVLAAVAVYAGVPAGLALTYLFSLQLASNLLGFDGPLGGRSRYLLMPHGLVRAFHAREAVLSAASVAIGLAVASGFALRSPHLILPALAWLLMGQATFSIALLLGRATSVRRPKALHVWQFFVHGGVLTAAGYVGTMVTLVIAAAAAMATHALLSAVMATPVSSAQSVSVTAVAIITVHFGIRQAEHRAGRLAFQP